MRNQRGMEFIAADLALETVHPFHKERLSFGIEPERDGSVDVPFKNPLEHTLDSLIFSRRPIHIAPCARRIRPDLNLKALHQSVIAWPILQRIGQVRAQPSRSDAAQYRYAAG